MTERGFQGNQTDMVYQIKVIGALDPSWSDWLSGARISLPSEEDGNVITILTVEPADQPALFGILDRIRDMNLLPVAIKWIDKEK